jgi:N-acetylglutamate synthase-like GNAT family acetyltransferase
MATRTSPSRAPFGEKEFSLEEFRGRGVLVALEPSVVASRARLTVLARTLAELVRNETRVVLYWPSDESASVRRLQAVLGALPARRGRDGEPVRLEATALATTAGLATVRAALWRRLRRAGVAAVVAAADEAFPNAALRLAAGLGVRKAVLLHPAGGLSPGGKALSFVDENVLETLLRDGQAEWAGMGGRRPLLASVRTALASGVAAVNVCTPNGVAKELFTYAGSGTLFTEGDYCRVEPLALEAFSQAERLLERGQRESVLKRRSPDEIATLLANGFGAFLGGRHLAGVASLLTAPYEAERAGEIAALYTITRFKGEGLGARLVQRLLTEARAAGLAHVFACAVDARAQRFFDQIGFERVPAAALPAAKWTGYDRRRRRRVVCFHAPSPPAT